MPCSLIQTQQLSSDVLTETEASATSGAAGIGADSTGLTEISGATVQALLEDIDDILAARTEPFTAQGDMLYRGASAPAILALGSSNAVLQSNGTIPEWRSNIVLDGKITWTSGDPVNDGFSIAGVLGISDTIVGISSGAISSPTARLIASAETGTTDDLVTINHQNAIADGDLLWLTASTGHTITLKNTGNIAIGKDLDVTDQDYVMLVYDSASSSWFLPGELYRLVITQTDPQIEGMPVRQSSLTTSFEPEWLAFAKRFEWSKHFAFGAGNAHLIANGITVFTIGPGGGFVAPAGAPSFDGVHRLTTGGNPGDGVGYIMAHDTTGQVHDGTIHFVFEAWISVDPTGAVPPGFGWDVWYGLTDALLAFGGEEVIFYGNPAINGGNWVVQTTGVGISTTTNTTVAVVGGWQRLKATYDGTTVEFFINGTLVASHTTNLTVTPGHYYFCGVLSTDPANVDIDIDFAGILHQPTNV